MANSVDLDQTAPIGAVCSGSMLFASGFSSLTNLTLKAPRKMHLKICLLKSSAANNCLALLTN